MGPSCQCWFFAGLLVSHTVAKRVQSVLCGELNHKQTHQAAAASLYFRAPFPLQRAALVWLSSPSLVCSVLVAHVTATASGLSFCPLCPNALPQISAISVLTSSTCSWSEGMFPLLTGL